MSEEREMVGSAPRRRPTDGDGGGHGVTALPVRDIGGRGATALPVRKMLDHRGPLSVTVVGAWYFITICANGHQSWMTTKESLSFDDIAKAFLHEAREYHRRGIWRLALFLVMPDHLHFIVNIPHGGVQDGGRGATALPGVVSNFKHFMASRYGLFFQRDFWDTRLRDDEQYVEKFHYVCNNPVRKGLCRCARDWPYVIAFDKSTGEERPHR